MGTATALMSATVRTRGETTQVYDILLDSQNSPVVGIEVAAQIQIPDGFYTTALLDTVSLMPVTTYTDTTGGWELNLIPSNIYAIHANDDGVVDTNIVPKYRFRFNNYPIDDILVRIPEVVAFDLGSLTTQERR